jgi:hypothetical protein
MAQYIDKAVLLAEIERKRNNEVQWMARQGYTDYNMGLRDGYADILSYIESLEVKEVKINKEISQFIDANFKEATIGHKLSLRRVAKYFFELGLKAQKGE